jgi:polyisoprenoid-binding protein YceI
MEGNLLRSGTHRLGPDDGALHVHTYREGMAQMVGHDLIIHVGAWNATLEVAEDGIPSAIELGADPGSLHVREGLRGAKPLTDKDRANIRGDIAKKILRGEPIAFRSTAVEHGDGRLTVAGDLSVAGTTRPARFELELTSDGRLSGTLPVTQSDWGIKPYRAFMGALKVRDTVDVVVDVGAPSG